VPFGNQLIDPRLPHRHDREFRRDEEAVGEHERQYADQTPEDARDRMLHGHDCSSSLQRPARAELVVS
jgi:hypothetical protein